MLQPGIGVKNRSYLKKNFIGEENKSLGVSLKKIWNNLEFWKFLECNSDFTWAESGLKCKKI